MVDPQKTTEGVREPRNKSKRHVRPSARAVQRLQHSIAHGPNCRCRAFEIEDVIAEVADMSTSDGLGTS